MRLREMRNMIGAATLIIGSGCGVIPLPGSSIPDEADHHCETLAITALDDCLAGTPVAESHQCYTVSHDQHSACSRNARKQYSGEGTIVANEPEGLTNPGRTFRDCDVCPEMIVIPAGVFQMGDLDWDEELFGLYEWPHEPIHTVRIPKPLAVGRHEVTFSQWDACVAAGGCSHRPDDQGWGRGERPVVDVSWSDAQQYIKWLQDLTGEHYRLLSESEWEYAARAGTTTHYSFGDVINTEMANYAGNWAHFAGPKAYIVFDGAEDTGIADHEGNWEVIHVPRETIREQTVEVGSFAPNAFGLFDMHGNVSEWVEDCWNEDYEDAPSDGRAWMQGDCDQRVLRGGSWAALPSGLRSAKRERAYEARGKFVSGFRVAQDLLP